LLIPGSGIDLPAGRGTQFLRKTCFHRSLFSLIAWLAQNLARADGILLVMAWAATIGTNLGIIGICAVAYRLINDLKDV
jgi:hypothetical protein